MRSISRDFLLAYSLIKRSAAQRSAAERHRKICYLSLIFFCGNSLEEIFIFVLTLWNAIMQGGLICYNYGDYFFILLHTGPCIGYNSSIWKILE